MTKDGLRANNIKIGGEHQVVRFLTKNMKDPFQRLTTPLANNFGQHAVRNSVIDDNTSLSCEATQTVVLAAASTIILQGIMHKPIYQIHDFARRPTTITI
uniref:Uncharacterized protein n=1 Tax=Romanomermis culicivorax TaxID=13658 RepID=A0A915KI96_ROMCU